MDYELASRGDPVARDLPPAAGSTARVPVVDQNGAEIAVATVEGDPDRITVLAIDPALPEEAEDDTRVSGAWVRDADGQWRLESLAIVRPSGPTRHPGV